MGIDVKNNTADVRKEEPIIWDMEHGLEISIRAKGRYMTGKQSVIEYLREVAVVNPNARIRFTDPDGSVTQFEASTTDPARPSKPVKPHPYGLEVGELMTICSENGFNDILDLMTNEFSKVSKNSAMEILEKASVDPGTKLSAITRNEAESIVNAIQDTKLMPPSAECLSPITEQFIRMGMLSVYGDERPGFFGKPISGSVRIHKGNPFSVEVGMVYGGDLPSDQSVRILRFANKVPLLFQPGACAITQAVSSLDWRQYGMEQRQGKGVPYGPAIILIHVFGPKIPYISESKEAIAPVDEIVNEIQKVLKTEMRQLRRFNNRLERNRKMGEKFKLVSLIIPKIAEKSSTILKREIPDYVMTISKIANVVFIREEIEEKDGEKISHTIVVNYTMEPITFNLKIVLPDREVDLEIKDLGQAQVCKHEEHLGGQSKNFTGSDYYFTDINPVYVQGAEELPADWALKGVEINDKE
jgi:DNA topoisomerase VI, subunit B